MLNNSRFQEPSLPIFTQVPSRNLLSPKVELPNVVNTSSSSAVPVAGLQRMQGRSVSPMQQQLQRPSVQSQDVELEFDPDNDVPPCELNLRFDPNAAGIDTSVSMEQEADTNLAPQNQTTQQGTQQTTQFDPLSIAAPKLPNSLLGQKIGSSLLNVKEIPVWVRTQPMFRNQQSPQQQSPHHQAVGQVPQSQTSFHTVESENSGRILSEVGVSAANTGVAAADTPKRSRSPPLRAPSVANVADLFHPQEAKCEVLRQKVRVDERMFRASIDALDRSRRTLIEEEGKRKQMAQESENEKTIRRLQKGNTTLSVTTGLSVASPVSALRERENAPHAMKMNSSPVKDTPKESESLVVGQSSVDQTPAKAKVMRQSPVTSPLKTQGSITSSPVKTQQNTFTTSLGKAMQDTRMQASGPKSQDLREAQHREGKHATPAKLEGQQENKGETGTAETDDKRLQQNSEETESQQAFSLLNHILKPLPRTLSPSRTPMPSKDQVSPSDLSHPIALGSPYSPKKNSKERRLSEGNPTALESQSSKQLESEPIHQFEDQPMKATTKIFQNESPSAAWHLQSSPQLQSTASQPHVVSKAQPVLGQSPRTFHKAPVKQSSRVFQSEGRDPSDRPVDGVRSKELSAQPRASLQSPPGEPAMEKIIQSKQERIMQSKHEILVEESERIVQQERLAKERLAENQQSRKPSQTRIVEKQPIQTQSHEQLHLAYQEKKLEMEKTVHLVQSAAQQFLRQGMKNRIELQIRARSRSPSEYVPLRRKCMADLKRERDFPERSAKRIGVSDGNGVVNQNASSPALANSSSVLNQNASHSVLNQIGSSSTMLNNNVINSALPQKPADHATPASESRKPEKPEEPIAGLLQLLKGSIKNSGMKSAENGVRKAATDVYPRADGLSRSASRFRFQQDTECSLGKKKSPRSGFIERSLSHEEEIPDTNVRDLIARDRSHGTEKIEKERRVAAEFGIFTPEPGEDRSRSPAPNLSPVPNRSVRVVYPEELKSDRHLTRHRFPQCGGTASKERKHVEKTQKLIESVVRGSTTEILIDDVTKQPPPKQEADPQIRVADPKVIAQTPLQPATKYILEAMSEGPDPVSLQAAKAAFEEVAQAPEMVQAPKATPAPTVTQAPKAISPTRTKKTPTSRPVSISPKANGSPKTNNNTVYETVPSDNSHSEAIPQFALGSSFQNILDVAANEIHKQLDSSVKQGENPNFGKVPEPFMTRGAKVPEPVIKRGAQSVSDLNEVTLNITSNMSNVATATKSNIICNSSSASGCPNSAANKGSKTSPKIQRKPNSACASKSASAPKNRSSIDKLGGNSFGKNNSSEISRSSGTAFSREHYPKVYSRYVRTSQSPNSAIAREAGKEYFVLSYSANRNKNLSQDITSALANRPRIGPQSQFKSEAAQKIKLRAGSPRINVNLNRNSNMQFRSYSPPLYRGPSPPASVSRLNAYQRKNSPQQEFRPIRENSGNSYSKKMIANKKLKEASGKGGKSSFSKIDSKNETLKPEEAEIVDTLLRSLKDTDDKREKTQPEKTHPKSSHGGVHTVTLTPGDFLTQAGIQASQCTKKRMKKRPVALKPSEIKTAGKPTGNVYVSPGKVGRL